MTRFIQVATTTDNKDLAGRIAQALVQQRLAACVQVSGPIASTYRWQGDVETAQEWLCTVKSRRDLFPRIAAAIREVHTYDVPEIIATGLVEGDADYLQWLDEMLAPEDDALPPEGDATEND